MKTRKRFNLIRLHKLLLNTIVLFLSGLLLISIAPAWSQDDPCASTPQVRLMLFLKNHEGKPMQPPVDEQGNPMPEVQENWRRELLKKTAEHASEATKNVDLVTELDLEGWDPKTVEYALKVTLYDWHGEFKADAFLVSRDTSSKFSAGNVFVSLSSSYSDKNYLSVIKNLMVGMDDIGEILRKHEIHRPVPPRNPKVEVWLEPEKIEVCNQEKIKVFVRVTDCHGKPSYSSSFQPLSLVHFDLETERGYIEVDKNKNVKIGWTPLPPEFSDEEMYESIKMAKDINKLLENGSARDQNGVAWVYYHLDRNKGIEAGEDTIKFKLQVKGRQYYHGEIKIPIESDALVASKVVPTNNPVFVDEQIKVHFYDLETSDGEPAPVGKKFLACTDHGQLSGIKSKEYPKCWIQERVDYSEPHAVSIYQAPSSCKKSKESIRIYDYCETGNNKASKKVSLEDLKPIAVDKFKIHCYPKFYVHYFASWEDVDKDAVDARSTGKAWINLKGKLVPMKSPGDLWTGGRQVGAKTFVGKDVKGDFYWKAQIRNNRDGKMPNFCPKDVVLQEEIGGGTILDSQVKLSYITNPVTEGPSEPGEYYDWLRKREKAAVKTKLSFGTELLKVPHIQSSYKQCEPGKYYQDEIGLKHFSFSAHDINQEAYLTKEHFSWSEHELLRPKSIGCDMWDKAKGIKFRCESEMWQNRPYNTKYTVHWCIGENCPEIGPGGSLSSSGKYLKTESAESAQESLSSDETKEITTFKTSVVTAFDRLTQLFPNAPDGWKKLQDFERSQFAHMLFSNPKEKRNVTVDLFDNLSVKTASGVFKDKAGKKVTIHGRPAKQDGNKTHILIDQYILSLWTETGSIDDFISVMKVNQANQQYTTSLDQKKSALSDEEKEVSEDKNTGIVSHSQREPNEAHSSQQSTPLKDSESSQLESNSLITAYQKLNQLLPETAPEGWTKGQEFHRPRYASWFYFKPEEGKNFMIEIFDHEYVSGAADVLARKQGKSRSVKGLPAKQSGNEINIQIDKYLMTLKGAPEVAEEIVSMLRIGSFNKSEKTIDEKGNVSEKPIDYEMKTKTESGSDSGKSNIQEGIDRILDILEM